MAAPMLYGVNMFATDFSIRPDEVARLAEERGFESLFLAEHTHIPANRSSQFPLGGDLPERYWHAYDPFVALSAAAVATTRLRLGTAVCLLIERDPITTAKEVASLDRLSGGRFVFGIGGGWNAEEMANHGTAYRTRWRLLRERVLAMKQIWTQAEPEFHGEFVNFDKIWSYPKPVQQPHPPILMGGDGPTTFDRVIEFCNGWLPIGIEPADMVKKIAALRKRAEMAGRDPKRVSVSVYSARPEQRAIEELEKAEVERLIFRLPSADGETLLPLMDRYATLIR